MAVQRMNALPVFANISDAVSIKTQIEDIIQALKDAGAVVPTKHGGRHHGI